MHMKGRPSDWLTFGLAMVGSIIAIVGLALFLLAVLLPPLRHDRGTAQAIEQLGAYLVLDGGNFSPAGSSAGNFAIDSAGGLEANFVGSSGSSSRNDPLCNPADHQSCAVNFYLTPTRIWALDSQLRPLVVIPAGEIFMATAFPSQSDWILRVRWQENSAEFIFDGLFAERRARLAEAGLRHLLQQTEKPSRARARAAGA